MSSEIPVPPWSTSGIAPVFCWIASRTVEQPPVFAGSVKIDAYDNTPDGLNTALVKDIISIYPDLLKHVNFKYTKGKTKRQFDDDGVARYVVSDDPDEQYTVEQPPVFAGSVKYHILYITAMPTQYIGIYVFLLFCLIISLYGYLHQPFFPDNHFPQSPYRYSYTVFL